MSNNKILGYFTLCLMIVCCYLTRVAICWEDHPDVAVIDHFMDFHLDHDRLLHDAMEDNRVSKENERQRLEWAKEIREYGRGDSGREQDWFGVPDRDK